MGYQLLIFANLYLKCDNINTLDIFNHLNNMYSHGAPWEAKSILSRYAFIVNKLDIHKIYIQKDFDEKYQDILQYIYFNQSGVSEYDSRCRRKKR